MLVIGKYIGPLIIHKYWDFSAYQTPPAALMPQVKEEICASVERKQIHIHKFIWISGWDAIMIYNDL